MAATTQEPNSVTTHLKNPTSDVEGQTTLDLEVEVVDYFKRAKWLRAAVLGANDGLLSTASLMMGVGAIRKDSKTMILTGIAGLVAGACSMATGEFVSVYSQYDTEIAQLKRDVGSNTIQQREFEEKKKELPSPLQAAVASALSFAVGAIIPLLGAAFVKDYGVRVWVVIGLASLVLLMFGWLGAVLGRVPMVKSSLRVLVGGWFAMAMTYGLTKTVGSTGL